MTDHSSYRLVLVTGMSGAGRTAALKVLEDLSFEAVDNVPLSLLPRLAGTEGTAPANLAVCIDARSREFSAGAFSDALDEIRGLRDIRVLFLDCDDDALARRYIETRHRHPLAGELPIADGISIERAIMAPVRKLADVVLDTTDLTLGGLKNAITGHFSGGAEGDMSIFVTSFSFKKGIPRNADLVFDVRFLKNPHYDETLRALSGRDAAVGAFIEKDPGFGLFFKGLTALLVDLLPRYALEGKSYLTIALGCTGGRHRSVFAAEKIAAHLKDSEARQSQNKTTDGNVHLAHRDLDGEQQGEGSKT